jgi:hypothetical protein
VESDVLTHRKLIIGLSLFCGLTAVAGGIELLAFPRGNDFVPPELLAGTPFSTFLIPGLLLAVVVGGTSLICAVLAWRNSRFAVDATVLAGGAMTVWIGAEVALMRGLHWLHAVYLVAGLGLLGLGILEARRSGQPRHRWVVVVTLAEALGYLFPALAGILTQAAHVSDVQQIASLTVAGMMEGLFLGAGQSSAFPLSLNRLRYSILTALAAGLVWGSVMTMMTLIQADVSAPVTVLAATVTGVVGLAAIGTAQWLELRRHSPTAFRWIPWTALAWVLALPMSFLPGPLVDEATPFASHVVLWGAGGLLMAYVMALVTWQGVRHVALRAVPG